MTQTETIIENGEEENFQWVKIEYKRTLLYHIVWTSQVVCGKRIGRKNRSCIHCSYPSQ
jgi:hypothetical protein